MSIKPYLQSTPASNEAVSPHHQPDGLPQSDYFLASVTCSEAGVAQQIAALTTPQQSLPVVARSAQLPALHVGDQVLAVQSRDGVVIVAAMAAPGTPPAAVQQCDDGSLLIDAPAGLTLQAGKTRITLAADGQLSIEGRDIHSVARGVNQLSGAQVKLN